MVLNHANLPRLAGLDAERLASLSVRTNAMSFDRLDEQQEIALTSNAFGVALAARRVIALATRRRTPRRRRPTIDAGFADARETGKTRIVISRTTRSPQRKLLARLHRHTLRRQASLGRACHDAFALSAFFVGAILGDKVAWARDVRAPANRLRVRCGRRVV
jgi:hypothetical protein